jgi:hypothetical protein
MITLATMEQEEEELNNAVHIVEAELMSACNEFYKTDVESALAIEKAWNKIVTKLYGKE